jgi:hypothetical protein
VTTENIADGTPAQVDWATQRLPEGVSVSVTPVSGNSMTVTLNMTQATVAGNYSFVVKIGDVSSNWVALSIKPGADPGETLYGDVNGNGEVDIADLTKLREYFATRPEDRPTPNPGADINGDGGFEINDLTALRRYFATPDEDKPDLPWAMG